MTVADPMVAELIREVLAEELVRLRAGVREERVRIAGDADLAAFARRVLAIADDRKERAAFEKGDLVFRLDAVGSPGKPSSGPGVGSTGGGRLHRGDGGGEFTSTGSRAADRQESGGHTEAIERGLLSERHVDRLPRMTTRVRIGREVRMTPLARDRLRRRGITVDRAE